MTGRGKSANDGFHEELRWVRVPEGAQRSRSRGTPGYDRDLLRDQSRNLLGPTESRPADRQKALRSHGRVTPPADLRQQAVDVVIDTAIATLTPYVQRAVEYGVDSGVDGVMRLVSWAKRSVAERKSAAGPYAADELAAVQVDHEVPAPGSDLKRVAQAVSGEEYRARLLAALAAEKYAAEEKRRLVNVYVADDALPPELQAALRIALERPASMLDPEILAIVVEFLDGSQTGGSQYVLLDVSGNERRGHELGGPAAS